MNAISVRQLTGLLVLFHDGPPQKLFVAGSHPASDGINLDLSFCSAVGLDLIWRRECFGWETFDWVNLFENGNRLLRKSLLNSLVHLKVVRWWDIRCNSRKVSSGCLLYTLKLSPLIFGVHSAVRKLVLEVLPIMELILLRRLVRGRDQRKPLTVIYPHLS